MTRKENMGCTNYGCSAGFENAACREASTFARMLLMPEDKFRDVVRSEKYIGKIAEIFGVPAITVVQRAKELGFKLVDKF
jgi:Zn-dependent peptidase ImmA (M78 family)